MAEKSAYYRLTPRRREYVDQLISTNLDRVESARRARFSHPKVQGYRLFQQDIIKDALAERLAMLNNTLRMEANEVIEGITEIARDKKHPKRLEALDKLARVHGLYNDQVTMVHNAADLRAEIMDQIKRLVEGGQKALPPGEILDAEIIEAPDEPGNGKDPEPKRNPFRPRGSLES